ncbi:hypothetical protein GF391_03860|nr:hypothetical protein [Candidatus Uhrbacteria bacterium]
MQYVASYFKPGGNMKTLYFRGEKTSLQLNDVICIAQNNAVLEVLFKRPVIGENGDINLCRLYLHRVGEQYIDTLHWCPRQFRSQFLDVICAACGFELKELRQYSRGKLNEDDYIRYYQLIPRQS